MKYIEDSALSIKASTQAASILSQTQDMEWQSKGSSRDVVTKFDLASEKIIFDVLKSSSHKVLSEESCADLRMEHEHYYWVVDPIDGTANFLAQLPYYAVSVGQIQFLEMKEPRFLAGSVVCPALNELFFTHGDSAAFLNGKLLRQTDRALSESLIGVCFPGKSQSQQSRETHFNFMANLNERSRGVLRLGSAAIQVCYTAAGRLNATYGFSTNLWDVGAGLAIASAAGCKIFTRSHPGTPRLDFIVGAPTAASELLALLQRNGLWKD